ncbi:hypothetical protein HFN99_01020 [Rhizobium laguerreae]|uniref:hypothetical protein n=1 Tax=Rhizobium laguerreae TaxID=1076926 RepID=UPI001C905595|nr:hypothetical protein [Rhizobium laguerreae]MBY3335514.1 hypothetical protein [Rhizobium laguerreae]
MTARIALQYAMWPIPPLPTDNLYKLLTFMGLAMYISAFYILYDTKPYEETGQFAYSRIVILQNRIEDAGAKPKPLDDNLSKESPYDRYREYRELIHGLRIDPQQIQQLRDMNEQVLTMRLKARSYGDGLDFRHDNIRILLFGGAVLMTLGGAWWYFAYQRHQDFLVKLSATEAYQRLLLTHAEASQKPPFKTKKTRKSVTQVAEDNPPVNK